MTKQNKLIAALTSAASRQPDPVKRGKIDNKIKQLKDKKLMQEWLAQ